MALTDNLVSYYKLDESSGNAADSVGSNTLTNNNSVTYAAGKINNGADFESSSSQSLSIADGTQSGLDLTTALSIVVGVKFESLPGTNTDMQFVAKWNAGANQRGYRLGIQNAAGAYSLRLGVSSAGTSTVEATASWTPSTGVWYQVGVSWNAGAYVLYVDASSIGSGTTAGVTSLHNSTDPFYLGRSGDGAYFDGMLDEVSIHARAMDGSEFTSVNNGGAWLSYPYITSSVKTVNSLARASVKTKNGLAIASIKTFEGLA